MTRRITIKPFPRAALAADAASALPVAGRADLLFDAAEVIERNGKATLRRVLPVAALREAAQHDATLGAALDLVTAQRPPIAGLALDRPRIVGIINVTPDSFSDGGRFLAANAAIARALELEAQGADMLDIGGESTRPGAADIDIEEEWRRIGPVVTELARRSRITLSVDTRNAEVMRRAVAAGARIINDVSALTHDPESLAVAAGSCLPVILMHAQGDPRTMQVDPRYDDVVLDVTDVLSARVAACLAAGIARERIIVDPGIGFGKTPAHNLALLGSLSILHGLGCAIMLGASRKSFIARIAGGAGEDGRLPGSLAAALLGAAQGVQFLRVHDVAATRQALAVWEGALHSKHPETPV